MSSPSADSQRSLLQRRRDETKGEGQRWEGGRGRENGGDGSCAVVRHLEKVFFSGPALIRLSCCSLSSPTEGMKYQTTHTYTHTHTPVYSPNTNECIHTQTCNHKLFMNVSEAQREGRCVCVCVSHSYQIAPKHRGIGRVLELLTSALCQYLYHHK